MFIKLLLAHIIISLLAIPALVLASNNALCLLLFLFSLSLYFLSGYLFTNDKTQWYDYFPVAAIGVILWLSCYYISPDSTGYKSDAAAGNWFYYELYITVRSPLNFIDFLNEPYSLLNDLIIKLAIPIIVSVAQFGGGMAKQRVLNR